VCCRFSCATPYRVYTISTSTSISIIRIAIVLSKAMSAATFSFASLQCGLSFWIGFTSHHQVMPMLLSLPLLLLS
jgi:hypothetical protein